MSTIELRTRREKIMYKHHGLKSSVEKSRRVEPLLGLGFFSMGLVRAIRLPFLKIDPPKSSRPEKKSAFSVVALRNKLYFLVLINFVLFRVSYNVTLNLLFFFVSKCTILKHHDALTNKKKPNETLCSTSTMKRDRIRQNSNYVA